MKRIARVVLGINGRSFLHLLRLDLTTFRQACSSAYYSASAPPKPFLYSIPEVPLDTILGARCPEVRLVVRAYEDGMLPSYQAMVLLAIAVAEAPREVLEIGTFMGHTTRALVENLPEAIVHTVDLPETYDRDRDTVTLLPKDDFHLIAARVVGREFRNHPCRERIRQHFADTASWDFSEAGTPTLFFIDGAHTYEYCRNDSEKCFELCAGRGVFLWHDCDEYHPGVQRFIAEWRRLGRDIRRISGTPIAYWNNV